MKVLEITGTYDKKDWKNNPKIRTIVAERKRLNGDAKKFSDERASYAEEIRGCENNLKLFQALHDSEVAGGQASRFISQLAQARQELEAVRTKQSAAYGYQLKAEQDLTDLLAGTKDELKLVQAEAYLTFNQERLERLQEIDKRMSELEKAVTLDQQLVNQAHGQFVWETGSTERREHEGIPSYAGFAVNDDFSLPAMTTGQQLNTTIRKRLAEAIKSCESHIKKAKKLLKELGA